MEAQFTKIETNLKTSSIETELLIGSIRAAKISVYETGIFDKQTLINMIVAAIIKDMSGKGMP